jgi:hypothetical protein
MGNGNGVVPPAYSQHILKEGKSLPIQCHSEDMREEKHENRAETSLGQLRYRRGEKNY